MTELSITEILEMTETIAIACGFQCKKDDEEIWIYPVKEDPFCGRYFNPLEDWNDFHFACETMKITNTEIGWGIDGGWIVTIETLPGIHGIAMDSKEAAFLALYKFSKIKIENKNVI